jgi:acyl carrier protein
MIDYANSIATQNEILAILTDLLREVFDDPLIELKLTDQETDIPHFDSAKKVHLVIAVEERFEICLKSREINDLRSVADWTAVIAARQRASK